MSDSDPLRFCQFLLDECLKRGVQLYQPARAVSVSYDTSNQLNGIRISRNGAETDGMLEQQYLASGYLPQIVPCTRIIITAGAWSPKVFATLFPKAQTRIPVANLAGHALLLKNPFYKEGDQDICHAVFATDTLGFSPELFARTGGEVYLAGLNSTQIPLPDIATDVHINPESIEKLKECAAAMMANVEGKELEVMRESLVRCCSRTWSFHRQLF